MAAGFSFGNRLLRRTNSQQMPRPVQYSGGNLKKINMPAALTVAPRLA
jgi:hypothetical protein